LLSYLEFYLLHRILLILLSKRISKELEENSKELEASLKRAVKELGKTDPTVKSELKGINDIDFESSEGMRKGYRFLEKMIENAKRIKLQL